MIAAWNFSVLLIRCLCVAQEFLLCDITALCLFKCVIQIIRLDQWSVIPYPVHICNCHVLAVQLWNLTLIIRAYISIGNCPGIPRKRKELARRIFRIIRDIGFRIFCLDIFGKRPAYSGSCHVFYHFFPGLCVHKGLRWPDL